MSSIYAVKGTSATGKGTRVVQLIEFLKTKEKPRYFAVMKANKAVNVGLYFKETDLFFIGDYVVSNKSKLRSWTSMDMIHSSFGGVDGASEVIKQITKAHPTATVVAEGEPMMLSNRWRPAYLREEMGFEWGRIVYFTYPKDDRAPYDARVVGRSGAIAEGMGWSRNDGYLNEIQKSRDESFGLSGFTVAHFNYDAELTVVGEEILESRDLDNLVPEFLEFAKNKPMLREIGKTNPLATSKRLF